MQGGIHINSSHVSRRGFSKINQLWLIRPRKRIFKNKSWLGKNHPKLINTRRTCGNCLIFCIKNYELQSEFNLAGTNREEARTE